MSNENNLPGPDTADLSGLEGILGHKESVRVLRYPHETEPDEDRDALFREAAELFVHQREASTSLLQRKFGVDVAEYSDMWEWSVENIEDFWASIWEYFEVEASVPYERVLGSRAMPGARDSPVRVVAQPVPDTRSA